MTDESEKTPSGDENESEINQAINKPFSDGHTLCILNLYIVGRPTFFFFGHNATPVFVGWFAGRIWRNHKWCD